MILPEIRGYLNKPQRHAQITQTAERADGSRYVQKVFQGCATCASGHCKHDDLLTTTS